jgi:peptidoglycan/LPS O-acetylase OafA/YrhL
MTSILVPLLQTSRRTYSTCFAAGTEQGDAMLIIGSILWMLLLFVLLSLAVPSTSMRHNRDGNGTYYVVWLLMIGLVLLIHFNYMVYVHQRMLALVTDGAILLLFLAMCSVRSMRRCHAAGPRVTRVHCLTRQPNGQWIELPNLAKDLSGNIARISANPPQS